MDQQQVAVELRYVLAQTVEKMIVCVVLLSPPRLNEMRGAS